MPKVATTIEEKRQRLDVALEAVEEVRELGLPEGSRIVTSCAEQLRIAQTAYNNAMSSQFKDREAEFSTTVLMPIAGPYLDQILVEVADRTDEVMGDGFFQARIAGRDLEIRQSFDGKSRDLKLTFPKESKPRTFRITNFSGNTPPNVDLDEIWSSKKTFIETIAKKSVKDEKANDGTMKEVTTYTFESHSARTIQEMWKILEDKAGLKVYHADFDENGNEIVTASVTPEEAVPAGEDDSED